MTRLKKFSNFFHSLKFRLILLFILLGFIPAVILRIGILKSYENRAVSIKSSEILSQAKILTNQIVASDYLSNVDTSDIINAELEQLSNVYDGRVMIIDNSFHIVKDTYNLDEQKTIISQEVIESYHGQEISKYDSQNRYIEMTIPLTDVNDTDKTVVGVMLMSVSTDSVELNLGYLRNNAFVIEMICGFIIIFFSVIVATRLVKPLHHMSKSIEEIQTGYGDDSPE